MPDLVVEFDCTIQQLGPLQEAAYRILGEASCHIETNGDRYRCRLSSAAGTGPAVDALRRRFLDLVTDENLRAKVARETGPVRDLLLALAFGALAAEESAQTPK